MTTPTQLYSLEKYVVVTTDEALNEAGTACDARGYAIVNKDTGITEHTSLCLPAAMFQAENFNRTLVSLLEEPSEDEDLLEAVTEDVTIN